MYRGIKTQNELSLVAERLKNLCDRRRAMIYIVLDTNILNISYNKNAAYDSFYLNKLYDEIVAAISENNFKDKVQLLIPQLVIDELYIHKVEAYEKEIKELNRIERNMSTLISIKYQYDSTEEYRKFMKEKIQEFLFINENLTVIPVCNEHYFKDIVEKSIKKEAPFEGKEKCSDKGFKDAVIFYSIIDFAIRHPGTYFYLTKDEKFHGGDGKLLRKQFKNLSGSNLKIYREYPEIMTEIVSVSPQTYVDHLEYIVLKQEYYLGKNVNEITTKLSYSRPQFKAEINSLEKIKYDIDRIYHDDMAYWKQQDLQKYEDENDMEYSGDIEVDVKYNKNGIWSVVFVHYAYTGGIHGGSWYTSRVYDLNTGENISLSKLLNKSEEAILQMVYDGSKNDKLVRKEENLYFDDFEAKYDSLEDVKFYLDEAGIHIYFDEYEAGCYASGIIEFLLISLEKIDLMGKTMMSNDLE